MVPNTFSYTAYPTYPPRGLVYPPALGRDFATCRRDGECRLRPEAEREGARVAVLSEN